MRLRSVDHHSNYSGISLMKTLFTWRRTEGERQALADDAGSGQAQKGAAPGE